MAVVFIWNSPLLLSYLRCFEDLPELWNRCDEDESSGIGDNDGPDGTSTSGQKTSGEDTWEGEDGSKGECRYLKIDEVESESIKLPRAEPIVKILQLLASQIGATNLIQQYRKRRPTPEQINIKIVAPPTVEWKMINVKRALRLAY